MKSGSSVKMAPPDQLRLADELALLLVKTDPQSPPELAINSLLKKEINWSYFANSVSGHGLSGIAYQALASFSLPEEAKRELTRNFRQLHAQSSFLEGELFRLLDVFGEEEIPLIVLKGSYLATKFYPKIDYRPFTDLDLLVKESDVERVASLLSRLGYVEGPKRPRFFWEKEYPEALFVQKEPTRIIEVHWSLLDKREFLPASFDVDSVWQKAESGRLWGRDILQLAPEHLLIYLCLHLAIIHRLGRLILYRDLAEVLRFYGDSFPWEALVEVTISWQLRAQVYFPLRFSQILAEAPVPEEALSEIRPSYALAKNVEKVFLRRNFARLPAYQFSDGLFLTLRDGMWRRWGAVAQLPYRAVRWKLKGDAW